MVVFKYLFWNLYFFGEEDLLKQCHGSMKPQRLRAATEYGWFCFALLFCNLALQTTDTLFLQSLAEGVNLLSESVTWSCQAGRAVPASCNLCLQAATTAGLCLGNVFHPVESLLILVAVANYSLFTDKLATTRWSWEIRTSFGRWHYGFSLTFHQVKWPGKKWTARFTCTITDITFCC